MRDLAEDLKLIESWAPKTEELDPHGEWYEFLGVARNSWPEAIKRALEAEKKIRQLEAQLEGR